MWNERPHPLYLEEAAGLPQWPGSTHCRGSAALCGFPGPVVLEMAGGHGSGIFPAFSSMEAENGCANLVISLLVDRALFLRKQRESWPLAI